MSHTVENPFKIEYNATKKPCFNQSFFHSMSPDLHNYLLLSLENWGKPILEQLST